MSISNDILQPSLLDSSAMQGFNESSGIFIQTKQMDQKISTSKVRGSMYAVTSPSDSPEIN